MSHKNPFLVTVSLRAYFEFSYYFDSFSLQNYTTMMVGTRKTPGGTCH
jgi:hypothetical protein